MSLQKTTVELDRRAKYIADKWIRTIGIGMDPTLHSREYSPPLPRKMAEQYNTEILELWQITQCDPYPVLLGAMEQQGLIPCAF
jgi:hypothetical protein